ncbi:MAG: molybdopterin-dependent oxidoreductase [Chloroflexi bacterium]|nr:molybdopterin-dependent oxidoreductase [Chloroflexota bacterium]
MALTRRQLLKMAGGGAAGAAVIAACRPNVREFIEQSPNKLPEDLALGIDNYYATQCGQCGSGCGVIVRVIEGRAKKIEGNPENPISSGKTCVRGQASVQEVYHPDRIRRPLRASPRGSGNFVEISWDEALNLAKDKLNAAKGTASNIVMLTDPLSGNLTGIATKLAAGLGAVSLTYEALDQNVLHQAVKQTFGQDLLPTFDIANAQYVLSFGADFLGGWISQVQYSRAYGDFRQGGRKRGYLVQVDPRLSTTATNADEWLPVKPGQEGKLALSIAYVLAHRGLADATALSTLTGGKGTAALAPFSPDKVADATGIEAARIEKIALAFGDKANRPALAIGGGSAGAHTNGVNNLSAILALNLLVGNVQKPGGVLFNPPVPIAATGAGGGGGGQGGGTPFQTTRAAAVTQIKEQLDRMRSGKVAVLMVRNADVLHGLPRGLDAAGAVGSVPYVISMSSFLDDTTLQADLVLPGHVALEDWGNAVPEPGPSFQMVAYQQPIVKPLNDTRPFGDILLTLADEVGLGSQFPFKTFKDALRDSAQKLQALGRGNISGASFEAYWVGILQHGGWRDEKARSVAAPQSQALKLDSFEPDIAGAANDFQFHMMPFEGIGIGDGRGAHLPWLQAAPDPITTTTWSTWVEVNKKYAEDHDLKEGQLVSIESPTGEAIVAPVYPNPATPPWLISIPMGQGRKAFGRYAQGRGVNPLAILDASKTDKDTGSLAWAATRVRMRKVDGRPRIPKMEGSVYPVDIGGAIGITKG